LASEANFFENCWLELWQHYKDLKWWQLSNFRYLKDIFNKNLQNFCPLGFSENMISLQCAAMAHTTNWWLAAQIP
jgi:hypothetical protein